MCCHITGSPPITGLKKCVPYSLSNCNWIKATVITGKAKTIKTFTTAVIHIKTGSFINDIPGALIFIIVVRKLNPAANEAIPRTWRPNIQ